MALHIKIEYQNAKTYCMIYDDDDENEQEISEKRTRNGENHENLGEIRRN